MSWIWHVTLAIALALPVGVAMGQTAPAVNPGGACDNASTTAAARSCENARYEAADRQLNQVYARVLGGLDPKRQEKMRVAQRAWLQFRDANAEFLASAAEGGTLAPLIKITVLADMTEARVKELTGVR